MPLIDALRDLLWERASGLCGLCGKPVGRAEMHVDHITPSALGGRNELDNLQPAHGLCNLRKGKGQWRPDAPIEKRAPGYTATRNLRRIRVAALLSQEELAEKSGVSRVAITRLERGDIDARFATVRKLAKALGVEPTELTADAS